MGDDGRLICGTKHLAIHVGVTTMQIGRYVESGMPKIARGQFDLDESCKWIQEFRRKNDEAKRQRVPQGTDFWGEKARLTALQAEKASDELRRSRGELMRVDELLPTLDMILGAFKDNMLGRGRHIASQCGGKTQSQIGLAIEDSDRAMLNSLADGFAKLSGRHSGIASEKPTRSKSQAHLKRHRKPVHTKPKESAS